MTTTCCIEQFIPEHPTAAEKKNNNAFFLTQKASVEQLFSSGTMQEPASPAMVLAFQTCVSLEPTFRRYHAEF